MILVNFDTFFSFLGVKNTLCVKSNAFWMSLGLGHVKPRMGSNFYSGARAVQNLAGNRAHDGLGTPAQNRAHEKCTR